LVSGPALGPKLLCAGGGADAAPLAGAAGAVALVAVAGRAVPAARGELAAGVRLGMGIWAKAGTFHAMAVVITTAAAALRTSCLVISELPFGRLNTESSLPSFAVTTTAPPLVL